MTPRLRKSHPLCRDFPCHYFCVAISVLCFDPGCLLGVRLFRVAAKNPWCRKTPIIYKNNCLAMYFNPACWARAKQWIRAEWMKSVYIGYGATFTSRWLNLLLFSGEAACNCGPFFPRTAMLCHQHPMFVDAFLYVSFISVLVQTFFLNKRSPVLPT